MNNPVEILIPTFTKLSNGCSSLEKIWTETTRGPNRALRWYCLERYYINLAAQTHCTEIRGSVRDVV